MSSVGGPRHGSGERSTLPGMGWQCPHCGMLNTGGGPCARCNDDPTYMERVRAEQAAARTPAPKPTGRDAAYAALKQTPPPAPEPTTLQQFTIRAEVGATEASVTLENADVGLFHGRGATLGEAVIDALSAMEEDAQRPRCPTCGQHWPEDQEYPETA